MNKEYLKADGIDILYMWDESRNRTIRVSESGNIDYFGVFSFHPASCNHDIKHVKITKKQFLQAYRKTITNINLLLK